MVVVLLGFILLLHDIVHCLVPYILVFLLYYFSLLLMISSLVWHLLYFFPRVCLFCFHPLLCSVYHKGIFILLFLICPISLYHCSLCFLSWTVLLFQLVCHFVSLFDAEYSSLVCLPSSFCFLHFFLRHYIILILFIIFCVWACLFLWIFNQPSLWLVQF